MNQPSNTNTSLCTNLIIALNNLTLSLRSQRNFSFCDFLCMNTPSRWPVSTERISMALLPQPMIWLVPMYATEVGISPHCNIMFFVTCQRRGYKINSTSTHYFSRIIRQYIQRAAAHCIQLLSCVLLWSIIR